MKSILRIKSKTYRVLLRVFGLVGLCFLIEACYGAPQGDYASLDVTGTVRDNANNQSIEGMQVSIITGQGDTLLDTTNANGQYSFPNIWFMENETMGIIVEDVDSINNGEFHNNDTLLSISGRDISAKKREVDFKMKEK